MPQATHIYAYAIQAARSQPRVGYRRTGRLQTCGEISGETAKRLINEMSHNSIGQFELVELKIVSATSGADLGQLRLGTDPVRSQGA